MLDTAAKKLAIFISGRGSNMEAILKFCSIREQPFTPVLVLSSNPTAHGIDIAKNYNIPTVICERKRGAQKLSDYGKTLLEAIRDYQPDMIALAGFMEILSPDFLDNYRGIILNIHPSLLPSFPGLHPHLQAINAGVKISGCTVHLVTAKVDAGTILAQAAVPVLTTDTEHELSDRILAQEHRLYPAIIAAIASGKIIIDNKGIRYDMRQKGWNCPSSTSNSLISYDMTALE